MQPDTEGGQDMNATNNIQQLKEIATKLDEERAYTMNSILQIAGVKQPDKKMRLRIALSRLVQEHGFPIGGDTTGGSAEQAPLPAWHGSRWKRALPSSFSGDE